MKSLFVAIYSALQSMGQARAAAYYARQGDFASAKSIMLK